MVSGAEQGVIRPPPGPCSWVTGRPLLRGGGAVLVPLLGNDKVQKKNKGGGNLGESQEIPRDSYSGHRARPRLAIKASGVVPTGRLSPPHWGAKVSFFGDWDHPHSLEAVPVLHSCHCGCWHLHTQLQNPQSGVGRRTPEGQPAPKHIVQQAGQKELREPPPSSLPRQGYCK